MRYLVAVKQVPDTALIEVDENGNLKREGVPSILDPYSEHALEVAVRLKREGDSIAAFTMGPPQAGKALRRCLEIGADEAYLLSDRAFAGADVHATSRTLSAFIEKFACDASLILMGKQAADGDTAQVPAETAQMLGRQQFCYCISIEHAENGFTAVQDYGDEIRTCAVPEGSVVSVSEGDINRRLPSIQRFIEASETEIKIFDRIALGLGNFSVGMNGSRTKIVKSHNVRSEHTAKVTDGSDPAKASEYIRGLL